MFRFERRTVESKVQIPARLVLRQWLWSHRADWVYSWKKNQKAKPFFILSFPRTGSSLLMERIATCDGIDDCGEVLNQRTARGLNHCKFGRDAIVRHIRRSLVMCPSEFAAVKIHFNHLYKRHVSLAELLASFPGALFVLLYRENILEQYCSQRLASQTRQFYAAIRGANDVVDIDLADWSHYREVVLGAYKEALEQLTGMQFIKPGEWVAISYEELRKGDAPMLHKAMSEFGVKCEWGKEPTRLKKQETRHFSEIVQDYGKIRENLGSIYIDINQKDGKVHLR